jgi:hypothetical protein
MAWSKPSKFDDAELQKEAARATSRPATAAGVLSHVFRSVASSSARFCPCSPPGCAG